MAYIKSGLGACLLLVSAMSKVHAADWYASIGSIIIDDVNYGGCMISVDPKPSGQTGGACTTDWISLNCKALDPTDYGYPAGAAGYTVPTKSDGAAKLGAAQLAYITNTKLYIVVNTGVKFNSRCVATRVQNTKIPAE